LLPRGRVLNGDIIARLQALEQAEGQTLTLQIRNDVSAGVLRDRQAAPAAQPRLWKEVELRSDRIKPGMVLARNLNHKEGYLLLARGNTLDEVTIKQLREFERINGAPMSVYIRIESH
jgi:hypothetical protein